MSKSLVELAKAKNKEILDDEKREEEKINELSQKIIAFLNADPGVLEKVKELDTFFKFLMDDEENERIDIIKLRDALMSKGLLYPDVEVHNHFGCENMYNGVGYNPKKCKEYDIFDRDKVFLYFSQSTTIVDYEKHHFKKVPVTKNEECLKYGFSRFVTPTTEYLTVLFGTIEKAFTLIDDTLKFIEAYLK